MIGMTVGNGIHDWDLSEGRGEAGADVFGGRVAHVRQVHIQVALPEQHTRI